MKRLSSPTTLYYKWIFPALCFGFLSLMFLLLLLFAQGTEKLGCAIPLLMGVVGYFMMKHLLLDLADEVFDMGDSLLVRSGTLSVQVPLCEIERIDYQVLQNPQRVTLRLRLKTELGTNLSFCPVRGEGFWGFHKNKDIEDLITRIQEAHKNELITNR